MSQLLILAALMLAGPASASVEPYLPTGENLRAVVGADGSTAGYEWSDHIGLFSANVLVGEHQTWLRDAVSIPFVAPLPGGGAIVVMPDVGVQIAGADGTLGPRTPIGVGYVKALYANRAGDAVAVLRVGRTTSTQFRPAGGVFGAPVTVDDDSLYGNVAISDTGETLLATRGPSVRMFSSGAAPVTLSNGRAKEVALALDAHGGALAAWARGRSLHLALRDRRGRWHVRAPIRARHKARGLAASTSPDGDAVLAYRDGGAAYGGGALRAVTATLATGRVSRPKLLASDAVGYPRVSVARDGSAMIVANRDPFPQPPHIYLRSGTGPFCDTTGADNPAGYQQGAGLTDDDTAVVLVGNQLLRDADRTCITPGAARGSG